MALTHLLYTSHAVSALGLYDLLEIQAVAIRNNARCNITGILLYAHAQFFQCLEGEQSALLQMFETIRRDNRHGRVKLLSERPAKERLFEQWHMAMLDLELHNESKQADFQALIKAAGKATANAQGQPEDLAILQRFAGLLDGQLDK